MRIRLPSADPAPQAVQPAAGGGRGSRLAPPRGGRGRGAQRDVRGRRVRRAPLPRRLHHRDRRSRGRRHGARRQTRRPHGSPGRTDAHMPTIHEESTMREQDPTRKSMLHG